MKKKLLIIFLSLLSLNSIAQTEELRLIKAYIKKYNNNVELPIPIKTNYKITDYNDLDIIMNDMWYKYVPNTIEEITSKDGFIGFERIFIYNNEYKTIETYRFVNDNDKITKIIYVIPADDSALYMICVPYE